MSDEHGRCRMELERYTKCSRVRHPEADILADALDRIEARLEAETTASQAARQTAERLIAADRDDWKSAAEALSKERDHWYQRSWETKRELEAARAELAALRERYRVRRYPEERPEGVKAVIWWEPSIPAWMGASATHITSGDIWCYAPPYPDIGKKDTPEIPTAPSAAPAATADDGRDATDRRAPPPVAGTGETAHDPAERLRGWERHGKARWGLGVAGSVLLIEHRLAKLEAALDAAGVKWEEE